MGGISYYCYGFFPLLACLSHAELVATSSIQLTTINPMPSKAFDPALCIYRRTNSESTSNQGSTMNDEAKDVGVMVGGNAGSKGSAASKSPGLSSAVSSSAAKEGLMIEVPKDGPKRCPNPFYHAPGSPRHFDTDEAR